MITWIAEGTWPACIDAARALAPASADAVVLHGTGTDAPAAAHGAYAGLLGRGRPDRDPARQVDGAVDYRSSGRLTAGIRSLQGFVVVHDAPWRSARSKWRRHRRRPR
ncbi:MAG: hypothetical protein ACRDOK_18970 [Streptosporangiaceae bacterium]